MTKGTQSLWKPLVTVGVFVAIFLAWIGLILSESGTLPTFGEKYEVTAVVPSASLMAPGARVTIAGAEVGSVKKVERASEVGAGARIELELTDDRVYPLPRDTRVRIRTRTQVGENYISLDVGRDRVTIPDGGTLAPEQADELVDVDQILSTLQGKTKERTRTMFREFGAALTGRGPALNRTLSGASQTIDNGTETVDILNDQRATVSKLVDQFGRVAASVGERGAAIHGIATDGVRSLRAIADRDASLSATLRELPATMRSVRDASGTLGSVSDRSAPTVDELADATRLLEPAFADLLPAAAEGRKLVRSLGAALPDVDDLLVSMPGGARSIATRISPNIKPIFCQLNPMLRYLSPYLEDTLGIVFGLGSASHSYDATGHLVRLGPILNEHSLAGAPPEVLDAAHLLLSSGAFGSQKTIQWKPYPDVGDIAKVRATSGNPSGPESLKATGFKYPRVEADC